MKQALLLIDIQNDFLPGGALAVPDGDAVIPVANRLISEFDFVVATQDWHPYSHGSFASRHHGQEPGEIITLNGLDQVLWPDHCIEDTTGAELADELEVEQIEQIIYKGTDPGIDSYSGFFDNGHRKATGLHDLLQAHEINDLTIVGLATDYCVKFTALDARQLGYNVTVITDGVRGVDLNPGDSERALEEMRAAGVTITD